MTWINLYLLFSGSVILTYGIALIWLTIGQYRVLTRRPTRTGEVHSDHPAVNVAVIIAVRNEEKRIVRCLDSIRVQNTQSCLSEVIVSDDFSEDNTGAVIQQFSIQHPDFPLVYLHPGQAKNASTGKKAALARAIERATGDIILVTDADTDRCRGWIRSMISGFSDQDTKMVIGPVAMTGNGSMFGKLQEAEFIGIMGVTCGTVSLGAPVMCNGANLAYRKEAYQQAGGFSGNENIASGDDLFLMLQIKKAFGASSIIFNTSPESLVEAAVQETVGDFIQQRMRWVSKGKRYQDPFLIMLAMITFLTPVAILGGIILGFFSPYSFLIAGGTFLVKMLVDYPCVKIFSDRYHRRIKFSVFILAQIFQVVYVPVAGVLGLTRSSRWKGRKVSV